MGSDERASNLNRYIRLLGSSQATRQLSYWKHETVGENLKVNDNQTKLSDPSARLSCTCVGDCNLIGITDRSINSPTLPTACAAMTTSYHNSTCPEAQQSWSQKKPLNRNMLTCTRYKRKQSNKLIIYCCASIASNCNLAD